MLFLIPQDRDVPLAAGALLPPVPLGSIQDPLSLSCAHRGMRKAFVRAPAWPWAFSGAQRQGKLSCPEPRVSAEPSSEGWLLLELITASLSCGQGWGCSHRAQLHSQPAGEALQDGLDK